MGGASPSGQLRKPGASRLPSDEDLVIAMTQSAIGVLISGRGSNLQALIAAEATGRLGGNIRVVVSNRPDAPGLAHAQAAGVETVVLPHGDYSSRDAYDRALVGCLKQRGIGLVCLAGFMRVLGGSFCEAFHMKVLNIHPSLLPAFPGTHPQRQALRHGVKVTGATVHFVTAELDAGPIVLQEAVPVLQQDDEDRLAARILAVEHRLYPEAVRRVLSGRWHLEGRRVIVDD
jgi:phosphoribosylglycinamide formyltransferase-1